MKIRELIKSVEMDFPVCSSLSFDNTGANVVNFDDEVKNVLVCLDITLDAINNAYELNANLIISHHPIIFNELKRINDSPVSKRIKLLNKYDISAYSCHTNFDANIELGMGKSLLDTLFESSEYESHTYLDEFIVENKKYAIGDILVLKDEISFNDLVDKLIAKLELDRTKLSFYEFKNKIKKVILIPGSGSSDVDMVIGNKPDLLITSELKHNQILDLMEEKISYINATHYGLEKVFIDSFSKYLSNKFDNIKIYKHFTNL